MKLLFVIHHPVFGGPHNEALRLHPVLKDHDVDLTVVLPDGADEASERLTGAGVDVVTFPLHRVRAKPDPSLHVAFVRSFRREVAQIAEMISSGGFGVVMIGGGLLNPHAALAARRAGAPVIWKLLDRSAPAAVRIAAMQMVARLSDAVMFNGHALIGAHGFRRRERPIVAAYYPPVDTELFRPSLEARAAIRDELGIPQDAPLVGTAANLNPLKGVEYFIRAASLIYETRPDAWFVVMGSRYDTHEGYAAKLAAEVARSAVPESRIIFTGHRADMHRCYAALDLKLITSRTEGTTTTAMEAMAMEVPVVAARVGAVPEVVEHGATGLLVPPEDPSAFARATLGLLDQPELCRTMGAAARERAIALYDVSACAAQHLRLIERVIAARP